MQRYSDGRKTELCYFQLHVREGCQGAVCRDRVTASWRKCKVGKGSGTAQLSRLPVDRLMQIMGPWDTGAVPHCLDLALWKSEDIHSGCGMRKSDKGKGWGCRHHQPLEKEN